MSPSSRMVDYKLYNKYNKRCFIRVYIFKGERVWDEGENTLQIKAHYVYSTYSVIVPKV